MDIFKQMDEQRAAAYNALSAEAKAALKEYRDAVQAQCAITYADSDEDFYAAWARVTNAARALRAFPSIESVGAHESTADVREKSMDDEDLLSSVSISTAARLAGVSETAIRNALKAGKFPNAYRTSDHPQRGEWRIPRADVEAWHPRKYPRGE